MTTKSDLCVRLKLFRFEIDWNILEEKHKEKTIFIQIHHI